MFFVFVVCALRVGRGVGGDLLSIDKDILLMTE